MAKKLYYKIGEACKMLDIQPYVLRYWETEFSALRPSKSKSGQRVYSEKDLQVIGRVKELLYDEGFTIAGAKKKLEAELVTGEVKPTHKKPPPPEPEVEEAAEEPAAKKAAAKKPTAKKATAKKATTKAAKKKAKKTSGVDTEAEKQIEMLRKGVRKALKEAQAILKLLE
ncbi:MAG: MerR family transcriptional regulator [Acidobacteria bacterium]|nr:MAG: MerR family transcriptional regulator [Acidobacteriota bacterium]